MDGLVFVIVGLALSGSIAILIQRRWPVIVRLGAAIAVCAVVVCAVLYFLFVIPANTLGIEVKPWYQSSPIKEIIYFLIMVLGMFARSLSVAIENRRVKNARRGVVR